MTFITVPSNAPTPASKSRLIPTPAQANHPAGIHPTLNTKKHMVLVLRHNGFSGNAKAVEALQSAVDHVLKTRRQRAALRASRPEKPSKDERLARIRRAAVARAAKECLRYGAAGGSSMKVALTRDPRQVGYTVSIGANWNLYRGSFKGWAANVDHHTITVPADWRVRVLRRGLATLDGLFTLTAQELVSHGDIQLFQATWVEQSRGFSVTVRQGVIARLGGESFHGETAEAAIRGVRRKVKQAQNPSTHRRLGAYELSTEAFVQRYGRYAHLEVCLQDAYDTGACEFGVRSWCHSVGIDPAEEFVTMDRILKGFAQSPLVEVRRTVLHVVTTYRRENRK